MKLLSADLLEEFYIGQKELYPDLTLEDFKKICFAPWEMLKHEIETGSLEEVRLKYFGVFKIYKGRAKSMLKITEDNYKKNYITKERYERLTEKLKDFIEKEESK